MALEIAIVGAGLSGNLLAIMLARRGLQVTVYERQAAPGESSNAVGRSINLALAARGIRALKQAEAFADIEPLLIPMNGRIVHESDRPERFLAYGQHSDEQIWSVSREKLNHRLFTIARDRWNVIYRFEHDCVDFNVEENSASIRSKTGDFEIRPTMLFAADGAGSTIRRQLVAAGSVKATEDLLDHGYKELTIPATADGESALATDGLHIWPRGGFMLIALPNLDQTFTATLFLPHHGQPGFDTVTTENVRSFFDNHFSDVTGLMPELAGEFSEKPIGTLGTVHCSPWSRLGDGSDSRCVLMIGDAAHAIVPFHGQGMNAAFEDCAELERLIAATGSDWNAVIRRFEDSRRKNVEAIAEMALENYQEMRDSVRDPEFEQRSQLSFELERRFPGRFIPRYSMVMFHPEIGYAEAQRRGKIQASILDRALSAGDPATRLGIASQLVEQRL